MRRKEIHAQDVWQLCKFAVLCRIYTVCLERHILDGHITFLMNLSGGYTQNWVINKCCSSHGASICEKGGLEGW